MRGDNLSKVSQLVLPLFLQVEGVCFPHPPTPRMPLSFGSAHRDDNSYFSLQEQASDLFLRVSTSWEESPRGRSFNCPPSGFALGWGRVDINVLCPLCANGARGADGNLCGGAVRSVDIWGPGALLLCLRKDSVQRGHLAFSMQQQYFPSGVSPGALAVSTAWGPPKDQPSLHLIALSSRHGPEALTPTWGRRPWNLRGQLWKGPERPLAHPPHCVDGETEA